MNIRGDEIEISDKNYLKNSCLNIYELAIFLAPENPPLDHENKKASIWKYAARVTRDEHQTPGEDPLLTHWCWDKMAAISQMIVSNAFPWMKMLEFRLRFHWNLFLRFQ